MVILPAIDLKDGQCVRLFRGDYSTAHRVAASAVQTAEQFQKSGAKWLHMVDLNGAKAAVPVNSKLIFQVVRSTDLKVELGGGIRTMQAVEHYLQSGISRVILGSAALADPDFTAEAVRKYGDQIAIGIDARNGMVAAEGWTHTSHMDYIELAKRVEAVGTQYIIMTDIDRDGMLTGPNLEMLENLQKAVSCNIIASGGVSRAKDIEDLKALHLYGVICGKALYNGDLKLKEALKIAEEE